ncbi:MAG TPA: glycosyltransferase [Acetobacteraceae bacterium]|nr:glycosyltransferase [Acetobacteraceae bacterium]
MPGPELSVCICTHNRPEDVRLCLDGLRAQTLPAERWEILVIDSASAPMQAAALARLVNGCGAARLIRLDFPGLSLARNAGAAAARAPWIAYLDDDAVPTPDWAAQALAALAAPGPPPALLGGRVLPVWEVPLPAWWPPRLRGVLSIVEAPGAGEYFGAGLPPSLEPCGANLLVDVAALRAAGGFCPAIGRRGAVLLSDEEVHLARRLQAAGYRARYDARLVVHHRIAAARLTPGWLLARLHWQGVSAVLTRRLLGQGGAVWRELPRRLAVAAVCAPAALVPRSSTRLLAGRWRLAYALGFIRGALGAGGPRAMADRPVASEAAGARRLPRRLIPGWRGATPRPIGGARG